MPANDITPEAQKALEKALKILEHARRKEGNEAEAAVAAQKYQEILLRYNLDEANIEEARGEVSGKREEQKLCGGMYTFQRNLWAWAAELNFCLHFITSEGYRTGVKGDGRWRMRWKHRLIGRTVNVRACAGLAAYLEEAIERLVMERVGNVNSMRFSNFAMSMRRGMSDRLCEKMADKRRALLDAERRERMKADADARRSAASGASTSTGVTISSYSKSEEDANMDFLHGEGWSARMAAATAAAAAERRRRQEDYVRWAAAHPEEARRREQEAEREHEKRMRKRRSYSRRDTSSDNIDYTAYTIGLRAAEDIGLDTQVEVRGARRSLKAGA